MGLLPIVLATRRLFTASDALDRWLRCIVLFGVAGSLGWFGVGWLANERPWPPAANQNTGDRSEASIGC